jgi:signal peptidase II
MIYFIAAALLVAADQLVKLGIRTSFVLGQQVTLIPNVVGLTYVQNTGMAFSSLSGQTAFLALVSLVASVGIAIILAKNLLFSNPYGKWPLALILAGAVGNLIDRVFMGFVTDMIEVLFINFAVFFVADCCVVVGGILLAIYVLFFWDKLEPKKEKL